ncbi:MAG: hypothetical protein JO076_00305 [Verrucomicrobia bacterium]|nr:hypothetical protein [Verrucomicrobiota bacterium]
MQKRDETTQKAGSRESKPVPDGENVDAVAGKIIDDSFEFVDICSHIHRQTLDRVSDGMGKIIKERHWYSFMFLSSLSTS